MKYVVLTSKHHEGFCLWDSAYTDYKVTNTPYGKDLLTPFVEAFRAEGLRVGFYYSLIDWHHPDFLIDIFHPLRNHPDVAKLNEGRDMQRYAEYMRNQVRELITQFDPDILWCDFSYPGREYNGLPGKGHEDWESEKLLRADPRTEAEHHPQQPAGLARCGGHLHAGAGTAAGVGEGGRRAGGLGGLPDVQRLAGAITGTRRRGRTRAN